jgi:hypothetical protein
MFFAAIRSAVLHQHRFASLCRHSGALPGLALLSSGVNVNFHLAGLQPARTGLELWAFVS